MYFKGDFFCLNCMWDEVVDLCLDRTVPGLKMPVYLTEGRHDQNTPIPTAERWFDQLTAPRKEWIRFEQSAHYPIKYEPALWGATFRGIILREETAADTCA